MQTKYIVVLGSLMSGLGKGVTTSSILTMLDFYNYKALPIKFDGYLNFDCGTMNPYQHGEVFVLDDRSEVDMDFGIYERFLNKNLTGDLSITGGKLYSMITSNERKGTYLGETVMVIPHLTNEIIRRIEGISAEKQAEVMVIEVGGTVGDIENSYFIEAMRQLSLNHDVAFVNLTYIPTLDAVGEQKTKPAQIGLRLLLQSGIRPDFLVCRSNKSILKGTREKLALFANLDKSRVIDDPDLPTLYSLPLHFMDQGFDRMLIEHLGLAKKSPNRQKIDSWKARVDKIINPKNEVNIAIVGKYTSLRDSYASVKEAVIHAGSENDARVNIDWIESSDYETGKVDYGVFRKYDGMIVTGGFGHRGTEGMINITQYAREHKVPYLGICLGMQLMAVEFARNVCSMKGANSTEFDAKTKYNIIDLLESQKGVIIKGGTMRLGAQECKVLGKDTTTYKLYNSLAISERHRHRYEFNNKYLKQMSDAGLRIAAVTKDPELNLVEFIEWKGSFGVGTQAHPELKSRLEAPAPLFVGLVKAAKELHAKK